MLFTPCCSGFSLNSLLERLLAVFSQGHGTTQVGLDRCFLSCQMGFVLRGLWSERGQNIYLKLHIGVSSFSSASHHLLIFLRLCMPVSARLFCDRIALFSIFCAPQWHFYYFSSHFDSMSLEEIAWSQQRTKWPWPLFRMRSNSLKKIKMAGLIELWIMVLINYWVLLCSFI